nr:hypothetical protein CFP56_76410 [Quercus suber]
MSDGVNDSPAHDALREHLDVPLGLKKKRSWMHSLREAVQRGALTAKAAVDNFRGESVSARKNEATESRGTITIKPSTSNKATPKSAAMSLRGHISHHGRRPSVFSTASRASISNVFANGERSDLSLSRDGGEGSPQEHCHRKRNSIASSFAGSLRGLRRRASQIVDTGYHERLPAQYPLPSSPVPIPVPALERLSLHFDPANINISAAFEEDIKRRDEHPGLLESAKPKQVSLSNPFSTRPIQYSVTGDKAPTLDLLDVPRDSFDFGFLERTPSPMPGTNLTLEVDGAHDDALDLFERSVMAKESRPHLRPMRSIDAMAEACAVAHTNDENATNAITRKLAVAPSTQAKGHLRVRNEARTSSSQTISTSSSLPSDMQEFSLQPGRGSVPVAEPKVDLGVDSITQKSPASNAVASSGPPSPTREVTLPFRCETITASNETQKAVDADIFGALVNSAMTPKSNLPRSKAAKVLGLSNRDCATSNADDSTIYKGSLYPWPTNALALQPPQAPGGYHNQSKRDDFGLDDYDEFKTQQLFGRGDSGEVPSEYHSIASDHDDIAALDPAELARGGVVVTQLYQSIPSPQRSSPIARTTDVGEVFWKFSSDQWLKDSDDVPPVEQYSQVCKNAEATRGNPGTNRQKESHNAGIDSAGRFLHPSDQEAFRPGMGDRLEFELKRSTRNMRYNALQQLQSTVKCDRPLGTKSSVAILGDGSPEATHNESPVTFRQQSLDDMPRSGIGSSERGPHASPKSYTSSLKAVISGVSELVFEQPDSAADAPDGMQEVAFLPHTRSSTEYGPKDGFRPYPLTQVCSNLEKTPSTQSPLHPVQWICQSRDGGDQHKPSKPFHAHQERDLATRRQQRVVQRLGRRPPEHPQLPEQFIVPLPALRVVDGRVDRAERVRPQHPERLQEVQLGLQALLRPLIRGARGQQILVLGEMFLQVRELLVQPVWVFFARSAPSLLAGWRAAELSAS